MTPPVPALVMACCRIRYPLLYPGDATIGLATTPPNPVLAARYIALRPSCVCRMNGPPAGSPVVCGCGRPAAIPDDATSVVGLVIRAPSPLLLLRAVDYSRALFP